MNMDRGNLSRGQRIYRGSPNGRGRGRGRGKGLGIYSSLVTTTPVISPLPSPDSTPSFPSRGTNRGQNFRRGSDVSRPRGQVNGRGIRSVNRTNTPLPVITPESQDIMIFGKMIKKDVTRLYVEY